MKVLLHSRQTGLYRAEDRWVSEPVDASDFHAGAEALRYVSSHHLSDMELCVAFDEPRYNFSLPVKPSSDREELAGFSREGNGFQFQ